MALRTILVFMIVAFGCVSSAWSRTFYYLPRYIAQPLRPTSYEECSALGKDYDKEVNRVSKAHDDCLQANTNTVSWEEYGSCSHPRCQGLHDQRDQLNQKRSAALSECRNDVARYQERQRRDEANRQAAEADRRARVADQRAREAKRRDDQQRREREAAEAARQRDERREKEDLARKALEVQRDVGKLARAKQDPRGTLQRKAAREAGETIQDAVGTLLLGDSSRDPEAGSVHKESLDQANALNRMRLRATNPFAYAASEAALRHTGRVQAGALEQWEQATGDLEALRTDTSTGANPFASAIRPLPSPDTGTRTSEVAATGTSPSPSRGTPPTGEVLAGSSPPLSAPSSNPFAPAAGTQRASGSTAIAPSTSLPTEVATTCFYHHSYGSTVCLGVPNDRQRERACWQHEGTIMCPQQIYERERLQELGQRPSN